MPRTKEQRAQWYQENKEKVKQYNSNHKKELSESSLRWYRKHRDEVNAYRRKIKQEALTHYGNGKLACVKCGESRLACLSIDHINGKGSAHKRELGTGGGSGFCRWLQRNNFPNGYQTLCMNCQFVKRAFNRECARLDKVILSG